MWNLEILWVLHVVCGKIKILIHRIGYLIRACFKVSNQLLGRWDLH